jgi:hypothetical protein
MIQEPLNLLAALGSRHLSLRGAVPLRAKLGPLPRDPRDSLLLARSARDLERGVEEAGGDRGETNPWLCSDTAK